jgi:hypothetical protein
MQPRRSYTSVKAAYDFGFFPWSHGRPGGFRLTWDASGLFVLKKPGVGF